MSDPRITSFLVLKTGCHFAGQRLFLGKAVLYRTHLRISGWCRQGRYSRKVELEDLLGVGWWGGPGKLPNLFLHFKDGDELALRVTGSALWRLSLESMLAAREKAERPGYRHQVVYDPEAVRTALVEAPPSGDGASTQVTS